MPQLAVRIKKAFSAMKSAVFVKLQQKKLIK